MLQGEQGEQMPVYMLDSERERALIPTFLLRRFSSSKFRDIFLHPLIPHLKDCFAASAFQFQDLPDMDSSMKGLHPSRGVNINSASMRSHLRRW